MFLRITQFIIFYLFISFSTGISQTKRIDLDSTKSANIKLPVAPQAEEGDVVITDGTNSLIRITDEGNFGAIELNNGVPSTTTNKIYNDGGTLKFNGSSLGGGGGANELDELSDAKVIGSNYFIGIGAGAVQSSSNGNNVGFGENALDLNSTGENNTAIGNQTLVPNNGDNNTAVGNLSLYDNQSGNENTAIGSLTLSSNKNGNQNFAAGYKALYLNEAGSGNIAIGRSALSSNISGGANIGIGTGALQNNTGNYNIAIGFQANQDNQNGSRNTLIGYMAGDSDGTTTHDKSGNIFLGYQAGYNETRSDKLYIENSNSSSPLIYGDFVSDLIGINGKLGVGTTNPSDVLHIVGTTGQNGLTGGNSTKLRVFSSGGTAIGSKNFAGTPTDGLYVHGDLNYNAGLNSVSDKRYKTNIKPLENTLDNLSKIRGVSYDWRRNEFPERNFTNKKQIGVIAQEVEAVFPELVSTSKDGYKSVDYVKLTPILIEAVKELNKMNMELRNEINDIKDFLRKVDLSGLRVKVSKN